jgi:magnesium chelatase subunit D
MHKHVFPFSAIIGQSELKLCLILNAINPKIGGVVIRGEKGTAKSTAVRALTELLPEVETEPLVELHGQKSPIFEKHHPSVVTLPLNATEDCVVGGIDFNQTIKTGIRVFQPGLLAKAHLGILYIDEVNLLDDHIVDIVLDSAASGENRVEREGMSFHHPAEFILVGTMNPEEGELRPQLLDRFGLCVEVSSEQDPLQRVELILRREAYDLNPHAFLDHYKQDNLRLAKKIENAKKLFAEVVIPPHLRSFISELCRENNVAGHRADLVIEQAAKALAAYNARNEVTVEDIKTVSFYALSHRRRDPVPPPPPPPEEPQQEPEPEEKEEPEQDQNQDQSQQEPPEEQPEQSEGEAQKEPPTQDNVSEQPEPETQPEPDEENEPEENAPERNPQQVLDELFDIGATFKVKKIETPKDRNKRRGSGRRSRSKVSQKQGRYIRSTSKRTNDDIALDATLRAAAPYQRHRENPNGMAVALRESDVHEKIREKRVGNLLLFLVDASGSMGARGRMMASKGAVMSLLLDAYQKRDKVAMVSFRKEEATVNLPITSSVELAGKLLKDMPVGGRTPFSMGLAKGYEIIKNYLLKEPSGRPIMLIISDGKANHAMGNEKPLSEVYEVAQKIAQESRIRFIVVDTEESGLVTFGLAEKISAMLGAEYFKIDDLKSDQLLSIVKDSIA